MDFEYHYTEEQEQFRREVSAWLDTNCPPELERSGELRGLDPDIWERSKAFQRRLGEKGWLAPTEPGEWGGGALTTDLALVFLEELGKRRLGWLLEDGASSLGAALQQWGTEEQKKTYLPTILRGQANVWRLSMEPGAALDTGNLGIQAFREGDELILNGEDLFAGRGPRPDYLWLLALADADASPDQATATLLVPSGLDGIRIQTPRTLLPGQAHRVTFDNVWVPPHCLIGDEGNGWSVMQATLLAEPVTEYLPTRDEEVADLFQYAEETVRDGTTLSKEPVLRQLLAEAYINSEITRLFRMRNAWMVATGQPITYQIAQTALWEKRIALRLSRIVRDIMGIYALLDHQDPRSPFRGRFDFQQRQSLARQNLTGAPEVHAVAMAKQLGLGQRKDDRRPASPMGTATGVSGAGDV